MRRSRGGRVALALAVPVLVVLALSQALLPGLAASRVRSRVAAYGQVHSVQVSAFPALELLWGRADRINVAAGRLAASPAQIASLLWQARGVGELHVDAEAAALDLPLLARALEVARVQMRKHGAALSATATLTQAQLAAALPSGVSFEPTASGDGEVQARASGALFGLQATLPVLVRASQGSLIAEPQGVPFGSIAAVTLFSDPHLKVAGVGVRALGSSPPSYEVTVSALLS